MKVTVMPGGSRFVVAVHVLNLLAPEDRTVAPDHIAESVNINPVVIRRILGLLGKAGLVVSADGSTRPRWPNPPGGSRWP
jgi:DNA-binding IscR family transcriptional regulator